TRSLQRRRVRLRESGPGRPSGMAPVRFRATFAHRASAPGALQTSPGPLVSLLDKRVLRTCAGTVPWRRRLRVEGPLPGPFLRPPGAIENESDPVPFHARPMTLDLPAQQPFLLNARAPITASRQRV